jgi:hypothetical protein
LETADEPHGLARGAKAELRFRAHRDPLHVLAQSLNQKAVAFVPAIVPDLIAQEALADPYAQSFPRHAKRS